MGLPGGAFGHRPLLASGPALPPSRSQGRRPYSRPGFMKSVWAEIFATVDARTGSAITAFATPMGTNPAVGWTVGPCQPCALGPHAGKGTNLGWGRRRGLTRCRPYDQNTNISHGPRAPTRACGTLVNTRAKRKRWGWSRNRPAGRGTQPRWALGHTPGLETPAAAHTARHPPTGRWLPGQSYRRRIRARSRRNGAPAADRVGWALRRGYAPGRACGRLGKESGPGSERLLTGNWGSDEAAATGLLLRPADGSARNPRNRRGRRSQPAWPSQWPALVRLAADVEIAIQQGRRFHFGQTGAPHPPAAHHRQRLVRTADYHSAAMRATSPELGYEAARRPELERPQVLARPAGWEGITWAGPPPHPGPRSALSAVQADA